MSLKLQADLAHLSELAVDLARRVTELERRPVLKSMPAPEPAMCRCARPVVASGKTKRVPTRPVLRLATGKRHD